MAAFDFFLKFDGIKGESTDAKHKDEIDVESWSWGETHVAGGTGGGGGASGKVAMQDFHFTMRLNTASIALMRACATGEHIKCATLTGRTSRKDQQDYLTFKFHDVLVSSFQTAGQRACRFLADRPGVVQFRQDRGRLPATTAGRDTWASGPLRLGPQAEQERLGQRHRAWSRSAPFRRRRGPTAACRER